MNFPCMDRLFFPFLSNTGFPIQVLRTVGIYPIREVKAERWDIKKIRVAQRLMFKQTK